ncbi:MAG TPA: 4-alpha-glucanotransferase [Thermodesulfobacteriota bacterium]|nr:4-alpha-glucanotransferase [Thermodesulfobacteriota bacterium]
MKRRGSGILLHITSLPSPFGVGDLGPQAYCFVDFLVEAKQSFWQLLPINPTALVYYNSPYHATSAFAGNPLLISPSLLAKEGLLDKNEFEPLPDFPSNKVDYQGVVNFKEGLFQKAYERFKTKNDYEYERFCLHESTWLDDFSLFLVLKLHYGGKAWNEWPQGLRDRNPAALQAAQQKFIDAINREKFLQYIFFKQWSELKEYCCQKNIQVIGDIPIYVQHDSADVWTHPEFFKLDDNRRPYMVAGVPPDYFSETGQRWGNPVYNWETLKQKGYEWWIERIAHNVKLFDLVRVDHFRGFIGYWEIPVGEKTAINGRWKEAPAMDFFTQLTKKFVCLPIIAEDLGIITPDVIEVMRHFEFPGMKILLFAFGKDLPTNPYIPHNLPQNCVAYTGTHDNNTIRGWFDTEITPEEKKRLFQYLGREVPRDELHWEMLRLLMMSSANTIITPMQDILGLGKEARMNTPATLTGNWEWKLLPDQLKPSLAKTLREMTEIYGRA